MNQIRTLREKEGLTQQQLAEQIGISQQSIFKYETGQVSPPAYVLIELSHFFQTSIDYILSNNKDFTSLSYLSLKLEKKEKELILNYRSLDANSQNLIQKICKSLCGK